MRAHGPHDGKQVESMLKAYNNSKLHETMLEQLAQNINGMEQARAWVKQLREMAVVLNPKATTMHEQILRPRGVPLCSYVG